MLRLRTAVVAVTRALLGAFVLVQVVYLFGSLLFNMEEAFRSLVEIRWVRVWNQREVNGFHQYSEATAQRQHWQLFAPEAWKEFKFLEMELSWDDPALEPVLLRATCEPENLNAFVHLGGFRLRKYEDSLTPTEPVASRVLFGNDELEENELPAETMDPDAANKMLVYMRWRVEISHREHPDWPPPSQVRLRVHTYRIPEPPGPDPWRWEDGGVEEVARWLP